MIWQTTNEHIETLYILDLKNNKHGRNNIRFLQQKY